MALAEIRAQNTIERCLRIERRSIGLITFDPRLGQRRNIIVALTVNATTVALQLSITILDLGLV